MLRLAPRFADIWNSCGRTDELAQRCELLMEACEAVGRDPATLRRSVFWTPTQTPHEHPWASIDAFEDYIGRHAEAGMQDFILQLPDSAPNRLVETVATDILPRLRGG